MDKYSLLNKTWKIRRKVYSVCIILPVVKQITVVRFVSSLQMITDRFGFNLLLLQLAHRTEVGLQQKKIESKETKVIITHLLALVW